MLMCAKNLIDETCFAKISEMKLHIDNTRSPIYNIIVGKTFYERLAKYERNRLR